MNVYDFLVHVYDVFVGIFPPGLQWLVTLLVLIGLIGAFVAMVRHNVVLIIVVIVLLPFLIPVLARFIHDLYQFVLYLVALLSHQTG